MAVLSEQVSRSRLIPGRFRRVGAGTVAAEPNAAVAVKDTPKETVVASELEEMQVLRLMASDEAATFVLERFDQTLIDYPKIAAQLHDEQYTEDDLWQYVVDYVLAQFGENCVYSFNQELFGKYPAVLERYKSFLLDPNAEALPNMSEGLKLLQLCANHASLVIHFCYLRLLLAVGKNLDDVEPRSLSIQILTEMHERAEMLKKRQERTQARTLASAWDNDRLAAQANEVESNILLNNLLYILKIDVNRNHSDANPLSLRPLDCLGGAMTMVFKNKLSPWNINYANSQGESFLLGWTDEIKGYKGRFDKKWVGGAISKTEYNNGRYEMTKARALVIKLSELFYLYCNQQTFISFSEDVGSDFFERTVADSFDDIYSRIFSGKNFRHGGPRVEPSTETKV
jgi:hypothetical protein